LAWALLVVQQKQAGRSDPVALSAQDIARKAMTLAVGSMTMMFLILVIKAWAFGLANSTWVLPADNG
jgi:hypothetical protein